MIIACENLEQSYGAVRVLRGITFEIHSGCTGLLGPNGAGKSTLFKSILGHLPVRPGRIRVGPVDPALSPLAVRRLIGYMPEADGYLAGMNGLSQVAFCGELSGLKRGDAMSRAHEVLNYVGLGEERYREVDGYSTGMRQRLKLAAALVHGPRLLLLDEPTAGLDPQGRDAMLALIDGVARHGGTDVVLSSHILRDIEVTCDQVVVLDQGRVLYAGSRAQFQERESRKYKVRVKTRSAEMAEALRARGCQVLFEEGSGAIETELPPGAEETLVFRVAREEGLQLRQLSPAIESLQDAFEKVVRDNQDGGLS